MKNNILSYHSLNTDLAALLLRFILGGLMAYHGYTKLIAFDQILPMFTDIIGIGAKNSFILLIFAELGCGLLVVFGLLTRLAVIPIFISMFVAYFVAHGKDPFQAKELAFVFLLLPVVIFILGAGKYSIDKLLFSKSNI
ncbi:DoxX family protein [Pedobacter sp. P351]|uniref:DoxX family protein n=1 Tax=Pedobacter superstes TaxID=3133441 RepID=UPI0030A05792